MSDTVNATILTALRDETRARLKSDAFFADIGGYIEEKGVTLSTILRSLKAISATGGKRGAAFVVLMPRLRFSSEEMPGPEGQAEITIRCFHHAIYNDADKGGTGKDADQIAAYVANILQHYLPRGLDGVRGNFRIPDRGIEFVGASDDEANPMVAWQVRVLVPITLGRTAIVARPSVTVAASEVTATCATSGATIYYTSDGSYPGSGNDAATEYTAPFAEPDTPYALRFGAELAGSIPSNTYELEGTE